MTDSAVLVDQSDPAVSGQCQHPEPDVTDHPRPTGKKRKSDGDARPSEAAKMKKDWQKSLESMDTVRQKQKTDIEGLRALLLEKNDEAADVYRQIQALEAEKLVRRSQLEKIHNRIELIKTILNENQLGSLQIARNRVRWSDESMELGYEYLKHCKKKGYKLLLEYKMPLPSIEYLRMHFYKQVNPALFDGDSDNEESKDVAPSEEGQQQQQQADRKRSANVEYLKTNQLWKEFIQIVPNKNKVREDDGADDDGRSTTAKKGGKRALVRKRPPLDTTIPPAATLVLDVREESAAAAMASEVGDSSPSGGPEAMIDDDPTTTMISRQNAADHAGSSLVSLVTTDAVIQIASEDMYL